MRDRVSNVPTLCANDVDCIVNSIIIEVEAKFYERLADVVERFRAAVFDSQPAKQNFGKNTRLSTDAGADLTSDEYHDAPYR